MIAADRLVGAGHVVRAWGVVEPAHGLYTVYSHPVEAARGVDVVVTFIQDADLVLAAMDSETGVLAVLKPGAWWVHAGPLSPDEAREFGRQAAVRSVRFERVSPFGCSSPSEGQPVEEEVRAAVDLVLQTAADLLPLEEGTGDRSSLVARVRGVLNTLDLQLMDVDGQELRDSLALPPRGSSSQEA
jgi:hypothetical protein